MVDETVHPMEQLRNRLQGGDVDVLRELIAPVVEAVMAAEIDAMCGAGYGERSPARVNQRNGYRPRDWDTRAGTIELQIPKLREGSYFPGWLLEPRRRAEKALLAVIADMYLAGVSTRRVDKLVQAMGIDGISKSQVSRLATELDEIVAMTREGGQGSSVRHIGQSDNRGAGACVGNQCRGLPNGTKIKVKVKH